MTYARAHLVDQVEGGYYHCTSRCVRQSWLCGSDRFSGRSFEHRRNWITDRIRKLAKLFAVDVYAFAVMSNHYHIVLRLDPKRTKNWTDEDVADRWLKRHQSAKANRNRKLLRKQLLNNPKKLKEIRQRLGNLSWFMRHINEPVARMANTEDGCAGRFWEGRFKSIALLDQTALLACMIYVDLNPKRANFRIKLPSAHTSAKLRSSGENTKLAGLKEIGLSSYDYLELLRFSSFQGQPSNAKAKLRKPAILNKHQLSQKSWLRWVAAYARWYRAYGLKESIEKYTEKLGQRWLRIPELRKVHAPLR